MPKEQEVREVLKEAEEGGMDGTQRQGQPRGVLQGRHHGDGAHLQERGSDRNLQEHSEGGGLDVAPPPGERMKRWESTYTTRC